MSSLYVVVKLVIGLQFQKILVSLVLDKRFVIPLESHLGAPSGDSTISDNSDASFSCPLESELIQMLVILSMPGDFHLCDLFNANFNSSAYQSL